jgi:membrane-associated phospholipid phosphatase
MALTSPALRHEIPRRVTPSARRPFPHEIVAAGYFILTGLFVVAYGSPLSAWWPILLVHIAVVLVLLKLLPALGSTGWKGFARDWAPVVGLTFIYVEVSRLNDLFTTGFHDRELLRIEALLFGAQPSLVLRRLVPSKPLSEYLHFGYFTYYALLPALGGALYLRGRRAAFRYCLSVLLLTFFACYLWFILYPVAGPWYVFERPAPDEMGWLFPHMEHAVLDMAASVGAAFPSSHVAAAVAMWLLAWRLCRPIFWVFAPVVPALLVGTVYGGFHYAVDALAGLLIGVAGMIAGTWLHRALGGETPDSDIPACRRNTGDENAGNESDEPISGSLTPSAVYGTPRRG